MAVANKLFNANRDSELIAAGTHFWCEGCLVARPIDDQSSDPRYCQLCHDFLGKEAQLLTGWRRPEWIPKPSQKQTLCAKNSEDKKRSIPNHTPEILAHTGSQSVKSQARADTRGRPLLDLPVRQIKRWQEKGHNAAEIRQRLTDKGIEVSKRTLYRILSGQRLLA